MDNFVEDDLVLKYRRQLMGIATILILYYHSKLGLSHLLIQTDADMGVDIFLFLSGVGVFYSLKKNNIISFYKRRLIRILPAYIVVFSIYYGYQSLTMSASVLMKIVYFFYRISTLNFWLNNVIDCWFLPAITICYLIAPLFCKILERDSRKGLCLIVGLIIINVLLSLLIPALYNFQWVKLILLNRLPSFLLGEYYGYAAFHAISQKKLFDNQKKIMITSLMIIVGLIMCWAIKGNFFPLRYVLFSVMVLPLTCLMARFCAFINSYSDAKGGAINSILVFLGNYSWEFYLIYERITLNVVNSQWINVLIILLVTIFLCVCLKKSIRYLLKKVLDKIVRRN
jgi:peptidoglycan/LPS O-acetylase OafA/YrhL